MKAGVSIVHLPSGQRVEVRGHQPHPLASVFKIPVMIEVARQIQGGQAGLSLDHPLVLRNQDRCLGSGSLQHRPTGTRISVREAVELMMTVSDNTATDMVFERIGTSSVNRLLADLGLRQSDVYLKNRPAWLISLGMGSRFRGMSPRQIAATWSRMSPEERHQTARQVEAENTSLSLARFQAAEDASAERNSHAENVAVAAAVDNLGAPSDFSALLGRLWRGQILDEKWTAYCLGVLSRQKYRTRIPRLLPEGTRVWHKTGTLAGIVNDAGILEVQTRQGRREAVVVVVLVREVEQGREEAASDLIAKIARVAWEAWR
jgi:beta-lactamase class A